MQDAQLLPNPEFIVHDLPALPSALFRLHRFSASTWNTSSLFGTLRNSGPRQTAKRRYLETLLACDTVIALQETRGSAADFISLPGSHVYYGTFFNEGLGDSRAGGTVVAIRRDLVEKATEVRQRTHQRGRIITVSLRFGTWIHFTAVHINPALPLTTRKLALTQLCADLSRLPGARFLLGDWSFIHLGDSRATDGGQETGGPDELGTYFEDTFVDYAELYQREYTFARTPRTLAASASFSRIDRLYTNLPQVVLEKYSVTVGVVGQLMGPSVPSDHRAVRVIFQGGSVCPRRPRISCTVARSPEFQAVLRELLEDYEGERKFTNWTALQVVTTAAHKAARAARPLIVLQAAAEPRLLAQVLLSALRLCRDGLHSRAVQLLSDIPHFRACLDQHRLHIPIIQSKIRLFMEEACIRDLAEIDRSGMPDFHKTAKKAKVRRTAAAHRLQRRRLVLDGLYSEDGRLAETIEEAGTLLTAHWAPIFAGGPRDAEAQQRFIDTVVRMDPVVPFVWPRGRAAEVARRLPDTTPGPDGLSYAFWGALPTP